MGLEDYSGDFDSQEISELLFVELIKNGIEQYAKFTSSQYSELSNAYYKEKVEILQNILKELDKGE